ncbi:MAG: substrate-binding domain-containing protein [Sphaerochaeta sp.]|nr:substrate-binding domain-containing protein [Sphaerochaeta sp.]
MAEGIDHILSPNGYSMLLSSSRWIEEREIQLVRSLISNRVQGVLIAPISENGIALSLLKEAGIPFVVINSIPKDPSISYVCCNNLEGGRIAAQFLNTYPSEQIIVITGFDHQSIEHRLEGFFRTISSPESIIRYSQVKTQEDGYHLVPQLITKNQIDRKKTTLFVTNDNVGIGITNRLVDMGIRIPEQVSVIGYDNIRISELCRIPLTTISQSITETGEMAAQSLLKQLKKPESIFHHLIQPSLIERKTTSQ